MDFRDCSSANGDSLARYAAYVTEQLRRVVRNVFVAPKTFCSKFSNSVGKLAKVLHVLKYLQERGQSASCRRCGCSSSGSRRCGERRKWCCAINNGLRGLQDGNIYDSSSDDMVRFVRFCVSRAKIIVPMSVRDAGSGAARLLFLARSF